MVKSTASVYNNIRGEVMPTSFHVIIRPCDDVTGYWAKCDMPNGGCVAQGDTLREVQKNIFEAMELYLEDYPDISDYYLAFEVCNA